MPEMWIDEAWEAFLFRCKHNDPMKSGASSSITEAAVRLNKYLRELEPKFKRKIPLTDEETKKLAYRRKDLEIQVGIRAT